MVSAMRTTTAVRLARRLARDLWHAVGCGPDQPPPLLRRVRELPAPLLWTLLFVAVAAGWVLFAPLWSEQPMGLAFWWPLLAGVGGALLVLMAYHPLLAWRLSWLGLLYQLVLAPWWLLGGGVVAVLVVALHFLVFLALLLAVAASQSRGVVFWVWLLSAGMLVWAVPLGSSVALGWLTGELTVALAPRLVRFEHWDGWRDAGPVASPAAGVLDAVPAPLLLVGLVTAAVLAGQLSRYRSRARQQLAVAEEHGLVLAERARIARELHDVIAHHMSMIAVRAETAPYRLRSVPDQARAEFQEISHESRTALTEMRRLLGVLRSDEPAPPTAPQPGLTDLGDLVETARAAGATVHLEMHGAMTGLPAAVDVSGYRIVQEALTNAARHAAGAPVRITLRRTGTELSVSVRNGPGNQGRPGAAGHGLRGMRERVAALGGQLQAGPTEDGGFEVSASLPLTGTTS
jgi:signal transduction histidine kinase